MTTVEAWAESVEHIEDPEQQLRALIRSHGREVENSFRFGLLWNE